MSTVKQIVTDTSQVSEARRRAAALGASVDLNAEAAGRLALIVSEGATNLLKHGQGGHILLSIVRAASPSGTGHPTSVQAIFVDKGPGIGDPTKAMRDGFSTAGTMGGGLGAMRRSASFFDLYTQAGKGTAILCRVETQGGGPGTGSGGGAGAAGGIQIDGVSTPVRGEELCGDAWEVAVSGNRASVIMVDGLGHGPLANRAVVEAVAAWSKDPFRPLPDLLAVIDGALRSTRGAACAVAHIHAGGDRMQYAGVGNIAGVVIGPEKSSHCVSTNGTLGQFGRQGRAFEYPWTRSSLMVMHSDGLGTRWNLADYPGLSMRSPGLIAAVLGRDMERGRDDATAVALKEVAA